MLRMETAAVRNIRALVARDLRDALRNPTTLMSCGMGVLLTVFIARVAAGASRLAEGADEAFAFVAALCIAPAFAGCVVELYVMAEERERGVYLTLAEVGVTAGQLAAAKWLAATVVTLGTQALACLLLGFAPAGFAMLIAFSAVGIQPLLLAGLACGLTAREQMSSSLLAVPLTLVAVAPILAFMSDTVRALTWPLVLGPAAEVLCMTWGMVPAAPVPALVVLMALWTIAAAVAAWWTCRRFARELAAERDRLA